MSNSVTMARPYAKAIFEYAYEKHQVPFWSQCLHLLSALVTDETAQSFIKNPSVTTFDHVSLLLKALKKSVLKDNDTENNADVERFLQLLARNKRLLLLPYIVEVFQIMRADAEKTQTVMVKTFAPYTPEQAVTLTDVLTKRLGRKVTLEMSVDKTLLGGAVMYAGDTVIDLSLRNQLNKLRHQLATSVPAITA